MMKSRFSELLARTLEACKRHYGERLVSVAVFGSVARGTMRHDSDIDLLVVAENLPRGRLKRADDFTAVEEELGPELERATRADVHTTLSPVLKTPEEVRQGSPLFLDMTDQAKILYDKHGFLARYLASLTAHLQAMGARRVYSGGGYHWVLKPDLKPGEDIKL